MKRYILLFLLQSMLTLGTLAFEVDGIVYEVTSDSTVAVVERWPAYSGAMSLPATVTSGGVTYKVASIGRQAFADCVDLTAVTLPSTVTEIGQEAFMNCTSLQTMKVGNTVTAIGVRAFMGCTSLTTLTLGTGLTEIPYGAFMNCTSLQSVTIPKKVTSIAGQAFSNCGMTKLKIGTKVTKIASSAFEYCFQLQELHLVNLKNWCKIDFVSATDNPLYYARNIYMGDTLVTALEIPDGVTVIKPYTFYRGNVRSIKFPETVTVLNLSAVDRCNYITSLEIPNSVTTLVPTGNGLSMINLKSITVGSGVTELPRGVFYGCTKVDTITLNEGLKRIGESAFYQTAVEEMVLPESVEELSSSFMNCTSLKKVTLGPNVRLMEGGVFLGNIALEELHCKVANPNQMTFNFTNQFNNMPVSTCVLYVPKGSLQNYRNHPNWKVFVNMEEEGDYVRGDLNGDGVVDVSDVSIIIDIVLGQMPYDSNADLNGDGTVDVSDVSDLIDIVLGVA